MIKYIKVEATLVQVEETSLLLIYAMAEQPLLIKNIISIYM